MSIMKIIQRVLWYFSPCRKCKEKDLEGLVACSCEKGIFKKKYRNNGINKNESDFILHRRCKR